MLNSSTRRPSTSPRTSLPGPQRVTVAVLVAVLIAPGAPVDAQDLIFSDDFEAGNLLAWSGFIGLEPPDLTPPSLTLTAPSGDVVGNASPVIELAFADADEGVDLASLELEIDGVVIAADCAVAPDNAVCPSGVLTFGPHVLRATIADLAGNRTEILETLNVVADGDPPQLSFLSPAENSLLRDGVVIVEGTVSDDGAVASVEVDAGGADPVMATIDGNQFSAAVELVEGVQLLTAVARDDSGNQTTATRTVELDSDAPLVVLDEPALGLRTLAGEVMVAGTVDEENTLVSVTLDGAPLVLTDGFFEAAAPIPPGLHQIVVEARDEAGNVGRATRQVERLTPIGVRIEAPEDLDLVLADQVTVSGTVSGDVAGLSLNGDPVAINAGAWSAQVTLTDGANVLGVVATGTLGDQAVDQVTVFRDGDAPRLVFDPPLDGTTVDSATLAVAGRVNDIGFGAAVDNAVTVTVNGVAAEVLGRTFLVGGLPLAPGANLITAEAIDASGNQSTTSATVTLEPAVGRRLEIDGGQGQRAEILTPLAAPLAVRLLDAGGAPAVGEPVLFEALGSNALLADPAAAATGGRRFSTVSALDGTARAAVTLGQRAGHQAVKVTAAGYGTAIFFATADPGPPAALFVDGGDQQTGLAGQRLPEAFVAVVTDRGFNRLGGVPVTFRVEEGGGTFGDSAEIIIDSDAEGRARAVLTLGPEDGIANHVTRASLDGVPAAGFLTYVASARIGGPPAATALSGVVLDMSDEPLSGATVRLLGSGMTTTSDGEGQFRLDGVPAGSAVIEIDGTTVDRPGSWPRIEFHRVLLPGIDNRLDRPIFLMELDVARGLAVDEATGGTLTVPEVPGFALEIAPGSVTFPGGGQNGVVSVTPVHGDKVPMVPGFGQQPRFVVTIQPAGARFDPPARLTLPNVDALAPGTVTELYSFDHDLARFVSIGPGTVSNDGTVVVSNRGVGVIEAGWHCGGNPSSSGTTHDCPRCKICDGSRCVPGCPIGAGSVLPGNLLGEAAFKAGCDCDDGDECTFDDKCKGSGCRGKPVKVKSVEGPCLAAVDSSVTFTAEANKPERVKWMAGGGNPESGKGGSFSTSFASEGTFTVTAFCKNSKSTTISVGPSCSGVEAQLDDEVQEGFTGAGLHGFVSIFAGRATYETCVVGEKWCVRLEMWDPDIGQAISEGPGRIDVVNINDTSVVNANTCAAIIRDLTPPPKDSTFGPPRRRYWVKRITKEHEDFHLDEVMDEIVQPVFAEFKAFVNNTCEECMKPSTSELDAKLRELVAQRRRELKVDAEKRAHNFSNAMYPPLIDSIKALAQANGWEGCQ